MSERVHILEEDWCVAFEQLTCMPGEKLAKRVLQVSTDREIRKALERMREVTEAISSHSAITPQWWALQHEFDELNKRIDTLSRSLRGNEGDEV